MTTTVVNKHHKVPYDVYIGRGSKWGNPFTHRAGTQAQFIVGSRDEAVAAYRQWIQEPAQASLLASLHELKGKVLCCYCAPAACHGHVLAELADALTTTKQESVNVMTKLIDHVGLQCYWIDNGKLVGTITGVTNEPYIEGSFAEQQFIINTVNAGQQLVDPEHVVVGTPAVIEAASQLPGSQIKRLNSRTFRVIVAGSRTFKDYTAMREKLDNILGHKACTHKIVIVSGNAFGADQLGERYAMERVFDIDKRPANWDLHGKSAGYKRNEEMAQNADACVVFWDGKSPGTKHMIDIAKRYKLPTRVVMV